MDRMTKPSAAALKRSFLPLCLAAAATLAPAPAASADIIKAEYTSFLNYHYWVMGMPDFDQRRHGFSNGGNMYCIPTATANMFAYAANRGFPQYQLNHIQFPQGVNYQTYSFNNVTNVIWQIAEAMSTDGQTGTKSSGWKTGANHWAYKTTTWPLVVTTTFRSNSWHPRLRNVALRGVNGSVVSVGYGRYTQVGTIQGVPIVSRTGGHAVSVVMAYRSGSHMDLWFRDPATDNGSAVLQSNFSSTLAPVSSMQIAHTVSPIWVDRLHIGGSTTGPPFFSPRFRILESVVSIRPFWGIIFGFHGTAGDDGHVISYIQPQQFLGQDLTDRRDFSIPGAVIHDIAIHPDGDHIVIAGQYGSGGEYFVRSQNMLAPDDHEEAISGSPITRLIFGRNRDLYALDPNGGLFRYATDHEWSFVKAKEGPVWAAGAFDDNKDEIVLVNTTQRTLARYGADLGNPTLWFVIPETVPMAGDASVSVNPANGLAYFITQASKNLMQVMQFHTGWFVLQQPLSGVTNPSSIDFDDRGNLHVVQDGQALEFEADANGMWLPVAEPYFAGYDVGKRLFVARSRSNDDPNIDNEEPFNIDPDDLENELNESVEDCNADLNFDGIVGVSDLLILLASWGPCGTGPCIADQDGDRVVGVADLLEMLSMWGSCP